jgi:hypothetical protein
MAEAEAGADRHPQAKNPIAGRQQKRTEMNRLYISDYGDDKNDGLTRETPIHSWQRAVKLCDGNRESNLMEGDATLQRLSEEIERRKKK